MSASPGDALKNHPFICKLRTVEFITDHPLLFGNIKRRAFQQQAMRLVRAFNENVLPIAASIAITVPLHQEDVSIPVPRNNEVATLRHLHQAQPPEITGKNLQPVAVRQFYPFTEQYLPLVARRRPRGAIDRAKLKIGIPRRNEQQGRKGNQELAHAPHLSASENLRKGFAPPSNHALVRA